MTTFRCYWEIDVEAEDARAAALEYEAILNDPERLAPIVTVTNYETGETCEIDLEDE